MAGERPRRSSAHYGGERVVAESADAVVRRGYESFKAAAGAHSDGLMACTVTLYYRTSISLGTIKRSDLKPGASDTPVKVTLLGYGSTEGATGTGHGHAEMDALHDLFFDVCGGDPEKILATKERGLWIQCEGKSCCLHCSAVLGLLNALPATHATTKSNKSMGSTQWSVPPKMRDCLSMLTGVPAATFLQFSETSSV